MVPDAKAIYQRALERALGALGVTLTAGQREALWRHFQLVVEANRRFNLTRITAPDAFAVKHHADALSVAAWCHRSGTDVGRVLDIGTGAGVPAVPLAVVQRHWKVTAIDGTAKKVRFVERVADELGLTNLTVKHVRAERLWDDGRFDLVMLRAVGPLARCLEYGAPHLTPGGRLVAYKTADLSPVEITAGENAAARLAVIHCDGFDYSLPLNDETLRRSLRVFRRTVD